MSVTVRLHHLRTVPGLTRSAGFCSSGTRDFFELYGLDWRTFARDGIDSERLKATGDSLAIRLAEHAEQQEATRGRQ